MQGAARLGVVWGIGGVCLLLASAVYRLSSPAVEVFGYALGPSHWAMITVWVGFMAYTEGYRGFHLQFSPRVVGRALSLLEQPTLARVLLAPAFCMGLFAATRKRLVVSWAVTAMIVVLVVVVRRFEQPWRGIVDVGVVVGLALGVASIVWHTGRAAQGLPPEIPRDLPA